MERIQPFCRAKNNNFVYYYRKEIWPRIITEKKQRLVFLQKSLLSNLEI